MTSTIPGVGPQHERASLGTDPRGILVFEYLPTDIDNAESSTQDADRRRAFFVNDVYPSRGRALEFDRPTTETEKLLLTHLGYTVPEELTTHVKYLTRSVRNRTWPAIGV